VRIAASRKRHLADAEDICSDLNVSFDEPGNHI
jgi:hypothetical protein